MVTTNEDSAGHIQQAKVWPPPPSPVPRLCQSPSPPQAILNCATEVAGSCHGGSHTGTYEYAFNNPVPFETCQVYEAVDNECSDMGKCKTCWVSRETAICSSLFLVHHTWKH